MIFAQIKLCLCLCFLGVNSQKSPYLSVTKTVPNEKEQTTARSGNALDNSLRVDIPLDKKTGYYAVSPPLVCPEKEGRVQLFPFPCDTNHDCRVMGSKMVCCAHRCIRGVPPSKEITQQVAIQPAVKPNIEIITRVDENLNNSISTGTTVNISGIRLADELSQNDIIICPGKEARIPFFSLPCSSNKECSVLGNRMVCCSSRCIRGVLAPKPEVKHAPSWFGLVERNCPVDPIAEILEIKECQSDSDCAPRICCPDKYRNASGRSASYCRTPQPSIERFPVAHRFMEPLRAFASYMQCTPPPPPVLDIFPKPCKNALDCFPNLCCQEGGRKYCRPAKRSILSLVAGVGQRLVPGNAARRFLERLN